MKLYCQYSGIPFSLPHLQSSKAPVLTVHPVFHMERKQLFSIYSDWQEGLLESETDRRLLFLAMLNATGLIDWRATANPTDSNVQAHMSNMYYTCKWVTAVTLPGMKLPQFAITQDTRRLDNISHWLNVWEHIREDFDAGYRTTADLDKQKQREEMLEKLIKTDGAISRFSGLLAQWAFEAANVPDNIRIYWRQILTAKGVNIFSVPRADIDELVEHFETALAEHGSIYSYTLLRYVRDLQRQIVTGLGFNITNSLDLVDVISRSEYTIIDGADAVTATERINIQKLINSAPSQEPREFEYPNKVAYMRAKISWNMAQRAEKSIAEAEDKLTAQIERAFASDQLLADSEADDETDSIV